MAKLALDQGVGYGIVLGLGFAFALGMVSDMPPARTVVPNVHSHGSMKVAHVHVGISLQSTSNVNP